LYPKASLLPLGNAVLLIFTAWVKYESSVQCFPCSNDAWIGIPYAGVFIAISGAFTSGILAVFIARERYILSFLITSICAGVSICLQIVQYLFAPSFCYYCLAAAVIFTITWLALCIILFWNKYKLTITYVLKKFGEEA